MYSCAKKIELEVAKQNEAERKREAKRRMREAIAERTSNKWKRKRNEYGEVDDNEFCCHAPGCNEVFRKSKIWYITCYYQVDHLVQVIIYCVNQIIHYACAMESNSLNHTMIRTTTSVNCVIMANLKGLSTDIA